ncbi:DUF294 nucleotidyltransferase-like domain-containing protein [Vibrio sp. SS-MA-C1-2]|uniref:DUF294 nucleotidyltransferase-like domain-containing protein n=1 Tax=Vibrio sp. SS-MA-C1-2 TaxID=2908646 RepID=UPI001F379E68|nr:DUF294 nucleotidyltransferase-like domain-containing protein [Vibrio sp. SS-MA-C1-2]UJF17716.1 DUF294 nucleotidyltransferase-like domain-containing protein [Vibrio sp. SS-MA-C1-2]
MPETLLPNIVEFIKNIDPFDKMSNQQLESLSRCINIEYLSQGDKIQMKTHRSLFIIRSGAIEQRQSNGMLRSKLEAEDMFGFSFLDPDLAENQCYEAIALQNTLIYTISHQKLNIFLAENPEYKNYFAVQVQTRMQKALDIAWKPKSKGLFIKKVADIACNHVVKVESDQTIQQVAAAMRINHQSSSAIVIEQDKMVGIITDRDMTERVVACGLDLQLPITTVMSHQPYTIQADELVLQAMSMMIDQSVSHLPVMRNGEVIAVLTTSDLVQNHRMHAIFLIKKIQNAESVEELASYQLERQAIFEALVEGAVPVAVVTRVMAMLMDAYTKRLIEIGLQFYGEAPCEFSWLVAGSHARNEIHMLSDQDSALVFSDSATESDRVYFQQLAAYVCNGLGQCGYPLCSGKFMAANQKWCQPVSNWKSYYKKWASNPEYQSLMNITVFLELRSVYGSQALASKLQHCLYKEVQANREFLLILTNETITTSPPLGIFNKLVVEKSGKHASTLNIKKYALNLLIDLARIYSLSSDYSESEIDNSTEGRFTYAYQQGLMSKDLYLNTIGALQFITSFRLKHQVKQLNKGIQPDNHIDPNEFSSFERKHLKDAFKIISDLQDAAKVRHGTR